MKSKAILAAIAIATIVSLFGVTNYLPMSAPSLVVNDSVTTMNHPRVNQEHTAPMQSTSSNDGLVAIQDDEELEATGGSDNNMFESESSDEGKSIDPVFANFNYIIPTHVKDIAADSISAKTSDVKSVSLEGKYGNPIYAVDVTKNGQFYEVDVDAITGKVLTVSQENINKIDVDRDGETNNG